MIVDELILKIKGDLDEVKKSLSQIEKDGEKSGKATGDSFGKGFNGAISAVLSAGVVVGIKSFFSDAIAQADSLQQSLLKVESSAKAFGQSTVAAKQAAQSLAKDGFLSVEQSATAISNLMASGLNLNQAKQFIEAEKNIGAFGNTIGNASQAVVDLTKGILTNSAEVIENLSPAMKQVNSRYQELVQTQGKAIAVQFLYNETLKIGTKYQGDAEKYLNTSAAAQQKFTQSVNDSKAAIGEGLQPVLVNIINFIKPMIDGFTSWFRGLSDSTKQIVLIGGAITAFIPTIAALISALRGLNAMFGLLALNPMVLGFAALAAVITTVIAVTNQLNPSIDETLKKHKEETESLRRLGGELNKTNKSKEDTKAINDNLIEASKKLGITLDVENGVVKDLKKSYEDVLVAKENLLATDIASSIAKIVDIRTQLFEKYSLFGENDRALTDYYARTKKELGALETAALSMEQQFKDLRKPIVDANNKIQDSTIRTGAALTDNNFLLDDFTKKLVSINEEYKKQVAYLKQIGQLNLIGVADAERNIKFAAALEEEQRKFEETQQNELNAALSKNQKEYDARVKMAKDIAYAEEVVSRKIASDKEQIEKRLNDRLSALEREKREKDLRATMDYYSKQVEGLNSIISSAGSVLNANSASGTLAGLSGLVGSLNPFAGGLLAVGSTLTDIFSELFDDSEKIKQQEEERKKILEEQSKLLEAQRKTAEILRNLELERSNLIDKETDTQLKLNKILYEDETIRKQKDLEALNRLAGEKAAQAGLSGSNPTEVAQSISSLQAQTLGDKAALDVLSQITSVSFSGSTGADAKNYISSVINTLDTLLATDLSGGVRSQILNAKNSYQSANDSIKLFNYNGVGASSVILGASTDVQSESYAYNGNLTRNQKFAPYLQGLVNNLSGAFGGVSGAAVGAQEQLSDAAKLLDTLSQIQDLQRQTAENTGQTAANTAKAIELRPDRERSFIDIGLGYVQSLGQRITGNAGGIMRSIESQGLSLPAELGQASVISGTAKTLQERMAEMLEQQVMQNYDIIDILSDIRQLQAELTAILDNNSGTVGNLSMDEFTRIQSGINRRRR